MLYQLNTRRDTFRSDAEVIERACDDLSMLSVWLLHRADKALKKLNMQLTRQEMEAVVNCRPGMVENLLIRLQDKLAEYRERQARRKLERQGARLTESNGSYRSTGSGVATPKAVGHAPPHDAPSRSANSGSQQRYAAASPSTAAAASSLGAAHPVGAVGSSGHASGDALGTENGSHPVPEQVLAELQAKDDRIAELAETAEFLELKIKKLEQLLRLKDSRIHTLTARLQNQATSGPE